MLITNNYSFQDTLGAIDILLIEDPIQGHGVHIVHNENTTYSYMFGATPYAETLASYWWSTLIERLSDEQVSYDKYFALTVNVSENAAYTDAENHTLNIISRMVLDASYQPQTV